MILGYLFFFRYLRYLRVFFNEVFNIDDLNKASFQISPKFSPGPVFLKRVHSLEVQDTSDTWIVTRVITSIFVGYMSPN